MNKSALSPWAEKALIELYNYYPNDNDAIRGGTTRFYEEWIPVNPILKYFEYAHLPDHLQPISKIFHAVAETLETILPDNAEKSTAFRKLLEAKDCAVRAAL